MSEKLEKQFVVSKILRYGTPMNREVAVFVFDVRQDARDYVKRQKPRKVGGHEVRYKISPVKRGPVSRS